MGIKMKRKLDVIIIFLCVGLILLLWNLPGENKTYLWMGILGILAFIHLLFALSGARNKSKSLSFKEGKAALIPQTACTELVLLSEEDSHLARWNIYGKNGIVIGRDVGENLVTVDLNESPYAGMIDVEHAVLNFSGNDWYIEDISSKNGVSIQKRDGRKYKISYGKPCRVERFDILFIGLIRLQIL